jgi:hypothetical protein
MRHDTLPRQARDRRKESSQKGLLSQNIFGATESDLYIIDAASMELVAIVSLGGAFVPNGAAQNKTHCHFHMRNGRIRSFAKTGSGQTIEGN